MVNWIKSHERGSTLSLHVHPNSSKNEICGEHGGRLKLKIHAPAREGEANETLIDYLSEVLNLPKKKIFLIHGESSRQKLVLVELSENEVIRLILKRD